MELYSKELLKKLKDTISDDGYYMPKILFNSNKYSANDFNICRLYI